MCLSSAPDCRESARRAISVPRALRGPSPSSKVATTWVVRGTCFAIPGSAATATCTRWATSSSPGRRTRRSLMDHRSCRTCARPSSSTGSPPPSGTATQSQRPRGAPSDPAGPSRPRPRMVRRRSLRHTSSCARGTTPTRRVIRRCSMAATNSPEPSSTLKPGRRISTTRASGSW